MENNLQDSYQSCFFLLRQLYRNGVFSEGYRQLVQSYLLKVYNHVPLYVVWDWDEAILEDMQYEEKAQARFQAYGDQRWLESGRY